MISHNLVWMRPKWKKASENKQPLVTHGSVISFNMHACAKCYNEKSVVWFTLISSFFCQVGPKFLQSWLPWSSQCQIQISSALCCCLLRNNHLHQKTTWNQKSNMGEISLFSLVLSLFLNLLIRKLKIHNAVTTFV